MAEKHQYAVHVRRAWTMEGIATQIARVLDGYTQEDIIHIDTKIDFQFPWPFRRNSAVIVARRLDA
jgi:cell wall assembly regulator SMI1